MYSQSEVKGITSETLWAALAERAAFDVVAERAELRERFNVCAESGLEKDKRIAELEGKLHQVKASLIASESLGKLWYKRATKAEADLATQTSALEEECYHHERTRTKRNEGLELLRAAIDHNEKVEAERDKLQKDKTCPTCGGQRKIPHWYAMDELGMKPCPDCKGKESA